MTVEPARAQCICGGQVENVSRTLLELFPNFVNIYKKKKISHLAFPPVSAKCYNVTSMTRQCFYDKHHRRQISIPYQIIVTVQLDYICLLFYLRL